MGGPWDMGVLGTWGQVPCPTWEIKVDTYMIFWDREPVPPSHS
ncbi:hypothetical protein JOC85_003535 [Bacillus mesophilus]|nr:hypothetical protein [Bacillus mesophilus]